MKQIFFITGTDTGVGKTYVSVALLKILKAKGVSAIGIKPLASGSEFINGVLSNEDARELQKYSTFPLSYSNINPYAFVEPIAPHIAAALSETRLCVDDIILKTFEALHCEAAIKIIEGVGGWDVPLNERELMSDLVKKINPKILLVVAMRVGCLNHAILSYKSIVQKKLKLSGWIANCIDPTMRYVDENIDTLKHHLPIPCLGIVKYSEAPEKALSELFENLCIA